ncbi:MAG: glycosyltransferase family 4 protein [bacterium]
MNRADVIIAIQKQEAEFFKRLTNKPIVTVGHLIALHPPSAPAYNNHELLFVGAITRDNQRGIEFFIKEILPRIQSKLPNVKLFLAGNICDAVDNSPACVKLGVVDDLGEIYQRAAIVINPAYTGTGLAIKSIEALSYAKPLITTPKGARGLEDGMGHAFGVAQSAQDFADKIIQLLENEELRKMLSQKAYDYACNYHQMSFDNLSEVMQKEHKTQKGYYGAIQK